MGYNWDEHKQTGGFVSFAEIGDSVEGQVVAVRTGSDFNGNPCPELIIRTSDGDRTLTAGQVMLKSALAAEAPQAGDTIRIVYSADGQAKPGKRAPKLFNVAVTRGNGQPPAAAQYGPDEEPF